MTAAEPDYCDIAIVGGGLAGGLAALALLCVGIFFAHNGFLLFKLNSYSQIFSSEVSGVALKRFFYFFIPAMLVVYFLRQDYKAWIFFLVSTVAFGLLTYAIVGGTRANIIIAFAIFLFIGIIRGWISLWMLAMGAAVIREGWRVLGGVRKAGVRRRLKGRVGVGEGLLRAAGFARDRPRAGWSGVWRRSSARRLLAPGFPRRTDGASRNARFAGDPGHRAALPVGHGDQPIAGRRGRGFARFRRARPRPALPRCRSAGHRLWSRSVSPTGR